MLGAAGGAWVGCMISLACKGPALLYPSVLTVGACRMHGFWLLARQKYEFYRPPPLEIYLDRRKKMSNQALVEPMFDRIFNMSCGVGINH